MINLVGGSGFCMVGGIEAVNRALVGILSRNGKLRRGYFRMDSWSHIRADAVDEARRLPVVLFNQSRVRFVATIVLDGWRRPRDHWFVTHVNYLVTAYIAALFRPGRVVVMLHAAELDFPLSWLTRWILRSGVRAIAVSNFTLRKAIALGVPCENISVVHHGLDISPMGGAAGARQGKPLRVLFVGRMDERYKGQAEMLDAAELLGLYGGDFHFDFAGGGTSLSEWVNDAAHRGLASRVTFHGRVSNEKLHDLYRTADVFAMPSQNEGFGLVYVEAMSAGLPCVASNVDAAQEVVVHGETGLCVSFGNSTDLAGALRELQRDPALRRRLGEAGRVRYEAHFTHACFVARLKKFIDSWQTDVRPAAVP